MSTKLITPLLVLALLQLALGCLQLTVTVADCAAIMSNQTNITPMKTCYDAAGCCWSKTTGCTLCTTASIAKSNFTDCKGQNDADCKATSFCCTDKQAAMNTSPCTGKANGTACTVSGNAGFCYLGICIEENTCVYNCGCFCGYNIIKCATSSCQTSTSRIAAYQCCAGGNYCSASTTMGACLPCKKTWKTNIDC